MSFGESAIVITTAPTERQVKEVLWRELRGIYNRHPAKIGGTLTHTGLDFSPNRYARGFSTDVPERFQGFHNANILFVVDEASGVHEDIYDAIEGSMTTPGSRLLLIGNPNHRSGTFFDAFHSQRSMWHTMHISAFDTPNVRGLKPLPLEGQGTGGGESSEGSQTIVSPSFELPPSSEGGNSTTAIPGLLDSQWLRDAEKKWGIGRPSYQIRVLGEFPTQSIDTLISLETVQQAVGRPIAKEEPQQQEVKQETTASTNTSIPIEYWAKLVMGDQLSDFERARLTPPEPRAPRKPRLHDKVVIGVDVARFGTDSSAICVTEGPRVVEITTHNREDTMQTAGRVVAAIRKYQPYEVRIDEIGIGAGVVDRLKEQKLRNIFGVNVSKAADDKQSYANLRAEMFDNLRKRFEEGDISIPDDPELIEQLASIRYSYTSTGQMQIESKESMSGRGLRSPDKADALALALGYKRPLTWVY
jgi:hypothetical protein